MLNSTTDTLKVLDRLADLAEEIGWWEAWQEIRSQIKKERNNEQQQRQRQQNA